jgi:hypothetical protein
MKIKIWICVVLGWSLYGGLSSAAHCQTAFDSNCYYPVFGDPTGFDTIYGAQAYQHLGDYMGSMPSLTGKTAPRLLTMGLSPQPLFLTSVETGPEFDLHKLSVIKRYKDRIKNWPNNASYGHFRSPRYLDMLITGEGGTPPLIYWADESGEYDTNRTTQVLPSRVGGHGLIFGGMAPYVERLTSDSVDDIVLYVGLFDSFPEPFPLVMALVKGGQHLYDQGAVAMWDDTATSVVWHRTVTNDGDSTNRTYGSQGDWRGTGRQDFVTGDDWGNLYYYRNDPPFSIRKFADAMREDTLLVMRDYSLFKAHPLTKPIPWGLLTMKAFPRLPGDRTKDLLIAPYVAKDPGTHNGICVFKGGVDFGSKRIGYDSSDFFIVTPEHYDSQLAGITWPFLSNGGDLTGTGNDVLITGGGGGIGYTFYAFYVLGKAMDDKIDLFASLHYGSGSQDTIPTTSRGNPTFIHASPVTETDEDNAIGIYEKGSIQLLRGADSIPVHLNPALAIDSDYVIRELRLYPNPTTRSVNITLQSDAHQSFAVNFHDMLGRMVAHTDRIAEVGTQTFHIELPPLASGTYVLEIVGQSSRFRAKLSVVE